MDRPLKNLCFEWLFFCLLFIVLKRHFKSRDKHLWRVIVDSIILSRATPKFFTFCPHISFLGQENFNFCPVNFFWGVLMKVFSSVYQNFIITSISLYCASIFVCRCCNLFGCSLKALNNRKRWLYCPCIRN